MAPSKKCRHDRERVTYCAECEEVLPSKLSTDGLALTILRAIIPIKEAVERSSKAEAVTETVATTPEPDVELISPKQASKVVGLSPDWCRQNYLKLGGMKVGDGPKPRKMLLKSAVLAYAAGQKAPDILAVEKPKPNGRRPSAPLIPIKGKAPQ